MKINAARLLGWGLRELGSNETQKMTDLWFDQKSFAFLAAETDKGRYAIKGGVFRHGELLACTEAAQTPQMAGEISYRQLLGAIVYDEEGIILGAIGDVRIDTEGLWMCDVDLSGGVLADLAFGRKRMSGEHLKDMAVELEGEK